MYCCSLVKDTTQDTNFKAWILYLRLRPKGVAKERGREREREMRWVR